MYTPLVINKCVLCVCVAGLLVLVLVLVFAVLLVARLLRDTLFTLTDS